jgi:adenine phosphoribosyltransferase
VAYGLEYGKDSLEVHADAFARGERVLVVDDVLATGGTAKAAAELAERLGAEVVGISVFIELAALGGRARLGNRTAHAVLVL